jgi:hypothetical protein
MQTAAVQLDPVRISAQQLSIDPLHTDAGATLTAADYSALPGERDYKSVMTVLPHVNDSFRGDPANVSGATGLENVYYIDGVNVTSPLKAERGTSLPYNFVRAVEIKTAGFGAQYGRGLGAVVNAITYSGTNTFEAGFFGYGTNSSLAADPTAQPTLRERSSYSYDVGGRVSGPILRDRMWFSAAYNPRRERANRQIQGLGVFSDKETSQIFAAKISWQPASQTNLELSLFGDPAVHDAVSVPPLVPAGYEVLNVDPYLSRQSTGGIVGSIRGTAILRSRIHLEFSAARAGERDRFEPRTEIGKSDPIFRDHLERTVSGGAGLRSIADLHRWTGMLRGTMTAGRHTATIGGEYEDVAAFRDVTHTGGYVLDRNSNGTFRSVSEFYLGTFHNRVPTAYLNDSWRVRDHLTFALGLRWSSQTLSAASGITAQRFQNEWQPRIGFIWQPDSSGTQRVFASWGRYYQQLPLNLSTLWYLDAPYIVSRFASDPRQPGAAPQHVDSFPTLESDWATDIGKLEVENSNEITFGYERLIKSSKLGAQVVRRWLRSSFQWGINPQSEKFWVLGTPGKGDFDFLPPPVREYTSLELSASGALGNANYRMSYVLSKSRGNYSGLYMSDIGVANPGGSALFMTPNQATNSTGPLPNDHRHVFKLSGSKPLKFGINSGASFTVESGSPINELAAAPENELSGNYSFVVPRGTAGTTPYLWDLDIRFSKELTQRRVRKARISMDLLNVGNPQRVVWLEELHYLQNSGTTYAGVNPTYKTPIAYQPPMMARLGLEFGW